MQIFTQFNSHSSDPPIRIIIPTQQVSGTPPAHTLDLRATGLSPVQRGRHHRSALPTKILTILPRHPKIFLSNTLRAVTGRNRQHNALQLCEY
jgi:hypothetical protein